MNEMYSFAPLSEKIMRRQIKILTAAFFLFAKTISAQEKISADTSVKVKETASESFNPGKLIINHIMDAYEWHLWGSHEHPVSIPLPVILYNKQHGFSCFLSSRFEHGETGFDGYRMEEGKIISEDGSSFYNFSISKNVLAIFFSAIILLWVFISIAKVYAKRGNAAPSGLQSAIEPIIVFVRDDIAKPAIGEHKYAKFMPYLLTIFFFIWVNNLLGLIPIFPGGANVTGNIAIPLTLACFTLIIQMRNSNKNYWRHIFAMPGVPLYVLPIISILEFIGIFLKPFVLMVRLFANIMAGHIVILVFFCLIFVAGQASTGVGFCPSISFLAFSVFLNIL